MSEQKSIHQLLKESSSNNEGFQVETSSSVVVMQTAHNDMKTTRIIPNNLSLRTNPISSKLVLINIYSLFINSYLQVPKVHTFQVHTRKHLSRQC
jgi:hypothetical protein